ncbi:MAG: glycine betaine ABC transporter substrate-binding protein [Dehalococcoidia bacterium]
MTKYLHRQSRPSGSQRPDRQGSNQDQFKKLINDVSAKLTTDELTQLNKQVGVDKKEPKEVAVAWLRAKGLLK